MFENKFRQAFPSINEGHLINTIETEEREREREREGGGGGGGLRWIGNWRIGDVFPCNIECSPAPMTSQRGRRVASWGCVIPARVPLSHYPLFLSALQ